jgi:hypothetical protein
LLAAEVEARGMSLRRTKSLTIDMPASLHRRFKLACVATDKLMVEEVLAFIERRTAELEAGEGPL